MSGLTSRAARKILLGVLVVAVIGPWTASGRADSALKSDVFGIAIKGYDTVAYFTEGRVVQGKSEFSYTWNEAEWHFSSVEHRDLFAANPEKYAPNHTGFCGVSLIAGKFAGENPEKWTIIDGKLYLGWTPLK